MVACKQHRFHLRGCSAQSSWLDLIGHSLKGSVYLPFQHGNIILCCTHQGIIGIVDDIYPVGCQREYSKARVQRLILGGHHISFLFLSCPMLFVQALLSLESSPGRCCGGIPAPLHSLAHPRHRIECILDVEADGCTNWCFLIADAASFF